MKGYIYKIINVENGDFYIGSTLTPQERKERHFKDLKNGTHHSIYLQRAYNKYGSNSFEFKIIKEFNLENEDELRALEERYINFCWNSGKLYNVSKKGSGGDLVSYHPLIEEIKEKQKKATKKRWETKTDEEKKEYSEKKKGKGNPNFGNKWTVEQKEKASKYWSIYYETHDSNLKGKTLEERYGKEKANEIKGKLSCAASKKVGDKNPFYGKHHSEETKEKIAKSRKGNLPPNSKKVEYNGVIYESAGRCAKKLNISQMTVCYRCRKELYGFKYV